jgi:hypothetical protein
MAFSVVDIIFASYICSEINEVSWRPKLAQDGKYSRPVIPARLTAANGRLAVLCDVSGVGEAGGGRDKTPIRVESDPDD